FLVGAVLEGRRVEGDLVGVEALVAGLEALAGEVAGAAGLALQGNEAMRQRAAEQPGVEEVVRLGERVVLPRQALHLCRTIRSLRLSLGSLAHTSPSLSRETAGRKLGHNASCRSVHSFTKRANPGCLPPPENRRVNRVNRANPLPREGLP